MKFSKKIQICQKCSEKNQYERLEKRNNLLESSIKARLNSQMSMEKKTQYADWVLDNSDDLDSIKSQVSLLVNKLFSMVEL